MPKQQRSRDTLARIVDATERLLTRKLFEDLSVQEIVASAGATVGSFYNLLGDKQALLPLLYVRHCQEIEYRLGVLLTDKSIDEDLDGLIHRIVANIVELHRSQQGLLRALVLHSHCFPNERKQERPPEMTDVLPRLAKLVADRSVESGGRRDFTSAKLGLLMVLATVREMFLYPETSAESLRISKRGLVQQLSRAWLGYLRNSG